MGLDFWPFDIFSTKMKYTEEKGFTYHSERYDKSITIPPGRQSDGATAAPDLCPKAFFVHDEICIKGKWDDGTEITNFQASTVYYDILEEEGKKNPYKFGPFKFERFGIRKYDRWVVTFLFGGEKLKKF
jgi:hypothetical protein